MSLKAHIEVAVGTCAAAPVASPALVHPDGHVRMPDDALLAHHLSDPYHSGMGVTLCALAVAIGTALLPSPRRGVNSRLGRTGR